MSAPGTAQASGWDRLPPALRPREHESRGNGDRWAIETTLLVLIGLLLAIATINDVARQVGVNHRLIADQQTWRHYTGHDYKNVGVDQELLGPSSQHEVVCGNTSPGPPKERAQVCLVVWGPVVGGRRSVHGGWYLPAGAQDDVRPLRYGCFGYAGRGACPR
jgi:hypothetical protein